MARRNSNGEGSIYRRKDGRWEGATYVLTMSGARKRVSIYAHTRAEVHAKLTEIKAKEQQGIATPDRAWKLGEYLDYWLVAVVKPNRRPKTYELYEANVRIYLKPDLGHYQLKRLSVPIVQGYLNSHLDVHKTVRKAQILREVLSSALTSAMRHELVGRNVARLVELPGRASSKAEPWSLADANHFLENTTDHWFHAAFVLLLTYGLRRGEVLGLRWADVDFVNNELRIEQQVYRANGVVSEGPLKTAASRRKLPLVDIAKDALTKQRAKVTGTHSHLVFQSPKNGDIVNPQSFTRAFQRACRAAGLRVVGPHTMRHTTATLLKNLGIQPRDAQLILGHSNITTTQQIYQHDDLTTRREAIERLQGNFSFDGNANSTEATLPSRLPSKALLTLDKKHKKTPSWRLDLYTIFGDLTENRTPVAGMKNRDSLTLGTRITEVRAAVQTRQRAWFLGVVAVNLAVKIEPLENTEEVA